MDQKTREALEGSPFIKWRAAVPIDQSYPFYAINEEQKDAAMEELGFLKSLRPVGGQQCT